MTTSIGPTNDGQPPATTAPVPEGQVARARPVRKKRSPWWKRGAVLLGLVLVGVLVALLSKKRPVVVETTKVERGTVKDEISSSTAGEVMAERKATVRSELSARVLAVKHERGERVKTGEVVTLLDTADLDAKVRQAQATLDAQRAQVTQAEAHAEAARSTAERLTRLAEHGAETAKAADDAAAQLREAEAAAQAARAGLAQNAAALQAANVARSHGALTAPFDGLLSDVSLDPGEQAQVGAAVFEIVDDRRLHVEATIDEADIARAKMGQPAVVRLDALPDHPVAGFVSALDPTVRTDAKGARTLRIEVEIADLNAARAAGVRPGMSANVDVVVAEKHDVLYLPTNVIIGRGTKRTAFAIENGVARDRELTVGISSWESTEIVAGLREGDRVVATLNVKGLADGVPVQIKNERAP